ncbi:MAG: response regulator [Opitutaceae bacterium]|nr:response regulator [Opitutaceae bacterium]
MQTATMPPQQVRPDQTVAPFLAHGPSGVPQVDLRGRKILVIEDDRLNLMILKEILKGEGFEISDADSAEEALTVYDSYKPDLILLDVMLPGIDGFACCKELHARYGAHTCPVIFITAKATSEDVLEGFRSGGIDYLPKPFRRRESLARIRTHLQTRLLMEEQQRLVAQLSSANAAKNRLLGMAAHDLRNPLASIKGLAEFLADGTVGPMSPDQLDLVKTIQETSQSMLALLSELLDVATVEAGDLKVVAEPTDFGALVTRAVQLNNINAAKKETKILVSSEAPSIRIRMDAAKIRQVVDNLLSNAVKYSPPKSTIRVYMEVSMEALRFVVQDEGPGIPPGEKQKLFKEFTTLSVRPTGGEKATGLGLAICRKIVEAHDGAIDAANLPEKGCEFSFTLPIKT